MWGEIVFSSRNLASNAASAFTDVRRVKRLAVHLMVFAWALRSSLRGQKLGDDASDDLVVSGLLDQEALARMNAFGHAPLSLVDEMRKEVKAEISSQLANNNGRIEGHWDLIVGDDIRQLLMAMTGCERINNTPMPFNYLTFLRIFMVGWILTYPL